MKVYLVRFASISLLLSCIGLQARMLYFMPTKIQGWSLRADFLQELQTIFNAEVFVESGTSGGGTTNIAKNLFKKVHTIELDKALFQRARVTFAKDKHVTLYHGDSGALLPSIVQSVENKKIMFWLDGHYVGTSANNGYLNTPIMEELRAIEHSGIKDSIILIDDICCFHPEVQKIPSYAKDYPTVHALRKALLAINPLYEIVMYGDIAIAYPPTAHVEVSPLIKAMTVSRFFSKNMQEYTQVLDSEKIIATQATDAEFLALCELKDNHFDVFALYPLLWQGVALLARHSYDQALINFSTILKMGYDDWRIYWYAYQAARGAGKPYADYEKAIKAHGNMLIDQWL